MSTMNLFMTLYDHRLTCTKLFNTLAMCTISVFYNLLAFISTSFAAVTYWIDPSCLRADIGPHRFEDAIAEVTDFAQIAHDKLEKKEGPIVGYFRLLFKTEPTNVDAVKEVLGNQPHPPDSGYHTN
jgi:hypothetical protein